MYFSDSESFRLALEYSPCLVIDLDVNGFIRWCNKAFFECTSFVSSDLIQKDITDFCPDTRNQDRFRELITLTQSRNEIFDFDVVIQTHNFDRIELVVNSVIIRDSNGQSTGIICFGKDATEQRSLEKGVSLAAEESRALFDLSSLPVFGVDFRGVVDVWNARLAALTGVSTHVRRRIILVHGRMG
jgi:PAS domain S-box-containing protein